MKRIALIFYLLFINFSFAQSSPNERLQKLEENFQEQCNKNDLSGIIRSYEDLEKMGVPGANTLLVHVKKILEFRVKRVLDDIVRAFHGCNQREDGQTILECFEDLNLQGFDVSNWASALKYYDSNEIEPLIKIFNSKYEAGDNLDNIRIQIANKGDLYSTNPAQKVSLENLAKFLSKGGLASVANVANAAFAKVFWWSTSETNIDKKIAGTKIDIRGYNPLRSNLNYKMTRYTSMTEHFKKLNEINRKKVETFKGDDSYLDDYGNRVMSTEKRIKSLQKEYFSWMNDNANYCNKRNVNIYRCHKFLNERASKTQLYQVQLDYLHGLRRYHGEKYNEFLNIDLLGKNYYGIQNMRNLWDGDEYSYFDHLQGAQSPMGNLPYANFGFSNPNLNMNQIYGPNYNPMMQQNWYSPNGFRQPANQFVPNMYYQPSHYNFR